LALSAFLVLFSAAGDFDCVRASCDLDIGGDEAVEGGEATSPAPSPDVSRAASALDYS